VVFGGDDLGDVEAFEAVRSLRAEGLPGLVVCSASTERPDLMRLADVVVDGPQGVVELLTALSTRR
jgi:trehalose 6-phosphate phosphatase